MNTVVTKAHRSGWKCDGKNWGKKSFWQEGTRGKEEGAERKCILDKRGASCEKGLRDTLEIFETQACGSGLTSSKLLSDIDRSVNPTPMLVTHSHCPHLQSITPMPRDVLPTVPSDTRCTPLTHPTIKGSLSLICFRDLESTSSITARSAPL